MALSDSECYSAPVSGDTEQQPVSTGIAPANTLKMRNRWLAFADEQDWIALQRERDGYHVDATHNRASAQRYRDAAAEYTATIEGDK